ncbi:hypothetical protein FLA_4044 [Filimonas lacunae]|nr:hypothetical protein FLA_4044 [Filimonas lacunae]
MELPIVFVKDAYYFGMLFTDSIGLKNGLLFIERAYFLSPLTSPPVHDTTGQYFCSRQLL